MTDLKKISIFSSLNSSDIKELKPFIFQKRYNKKEIIFSEGDSPEWLHIVTNGKVKITKISKKGREIILEIISSMEFFGAPAVISGFPYPANAIAAENTETLRISRGDLMKILDRFPSVMYSFAMNMGDRIKNSHETLKNIAIEKVESRIAALLLKLDEKKSDNKSTIIKLTKKDISEMVGTTVETSIRTISKFKKLGLLTQIDGKIIIKDTAKLKTFCS